jgi:hypothetical protein
MMDRETRREWWKGEMAALGVVLALLGMAGSTLNLSMTVGKFVENTDIRLKHIENYIMKDEQDSVSQLEKGYLMDKIARNTDELKDCRVNTRRELEGLHAKVDRILKDGHSHVQ